MPYYLYIHNIYLYQYHDTKPNPINIDWLLGLTPTQCSFKLGMHLKLILHMTITISGKRSLVILIKLQTTLFNVLTISNVSFTPLYKGVKTCWLDMQKHTKTRLIQQFTSAKLCYCSASKVTYNFLSNFIS